MGLRNSYLVLVLSAWLAGCTVDETNLERRGGPLPQPSAEGVLMMAAAGAGGASDAAPAIPFCAALTVIRAKCQRCHQDPPQNGAPAPFLTYEDTQGQYFDSEFKFFELMLLDVDKGFMPLVALNDPPTSLMPPVEPLTADEKTTLLGWLEQGARPEGGTDCP
jgi:hypothetical protein